jgi:hypothetical protein
MAVTCCVFAAGFTAAGCSSQPAGAAAGTQAGAGSPAQSAGASGTPVAVSDGGMGPTAAAQPTRAASGNSTTGSTGNAGGTGNAGSAKSTAAGKCQPSSLSFAFGATTGMNQKKQAVDMTNTGSAACTMAGFPGVDLVGDARGQQNYTWPLERQSASYSALTLPPGGEAHFTIMYLVANPGSSGNIDVTHMVITPPGDYTHAQMAWDQGILLQDAATHPGTYISPVEPGA